MVPLVQRRVLEYLNQWDDQDAIAAAKGLGNGWEHVQLSQILLNTSSMGYYCSRVNETLYRFLWFHPNQNIVVDCLSKSLIVPEWYNKDVSTLRDLAPQCHGMLGVGTYSVHNNQLQLSICYGKSVILESILQLVDRRKLLTAKGKEFHFCSKINKN